MNRIEPLQRQILNAPFIDNSMSYYELISKLMGYINLLIDSANGQDKQIEELTELYNQLSDFINVYLGSPQFEEKLGELLDELAANGTLANIINNQVFSQINADIVALEGNLATISSSVNTTIENLPQYKSIKHFPRLPGETNDTNRFQRAFDSGYSIVLEVNGNYVIEEANINRSNFTLTGNGATIKTITESGTAINISGSVENIDINNVKFIGLANGDTDAAAGIKIKHNGNSGAKNASAKNIRITSCSFKTFVFGVYAGNVTGLYIDKCFGTGFQYVASVGAGGYFILTETCFDVYITNNYAQALTKDRHAIYISCGNSFINKIGANINIYNNTFHWNGGQAMTYLENIISVRSHQGVTISNNILSGGYGGIMLVPSHGDINDVTITGNVVTDIRANTNDRHCIGSVVSDTTPYRTKNIVVTGNTVRGSTDKVFGITLADVDKGSVIGNNVKVIDTSFGVYGYRATEMLLSEKIISVAL